MSEFVKTASLFLKACNIHVDNTFFERRLRSHPDYPALTSLTDTLDELGIPYSALFVDKDRVNELNFPALFHTGNGGKEDFDIVRDRDHLRQEAPALLSRWDGITLTITPGSPVKNPEHADLIRQKRSTRRKQLLLPLIALSLAVTANTLHFSPWLAALSLLSIAGAFVCSLIILHSMGKTNTFVQQLCSTSEQTQNGCDKVLHSKAAHLFGNTGLGDIGAVYFTGLFLFLSATTVLGTPGPALTFLLLPAGLSIPLVAYSLLYQRRVAKAWCTMCLLVATVLILQAAVVAAALFSISTSSLTELSTIALAAAGSFLLASAWFFIAPLLRKAADGEQLTTRLTKVKRDPDIFLLHLGRSEPVDTSPLPGDITLGNCHSPLQIMIVSNPFCNPCANAHQQLEQLLASHGSSVGLTIRFLFYPVPGIQDDKRKEVVKLIHAACRQHPPALTPNEKHPVDTWFSGMDPDKFRTRYQLPEHPEIPEQLLQPQEQWCRQQNISFTPTLYVNGHSLPRHEYEITDLAGLLPALTDRLDTLTPEKHPQFFNH